MELPATPWKDGEDRISLKACSLRSCSLRPHYHFVLEGYLSLLFYLKLYFNILIKFRMLSTSRPPGLWMETSLFFMSSRFHHIVSDWYCVPPSCSPASELSYLLPHCLPPPSTHPMVCPLHHSCCGSMVCLTSLTPVVSRLSPNKPHSEEWLIWASLSSSLQPFGYNSPLFSVCLTQKQKEKQLPKLTLPWGRRMAVSWTSSLKCSCHYDPCRLQENAGMNSLHWNNMLSVLRTNRLFFGVS